MKQETKKAIPGSSQVGRIYSSPGFHRYVLLPFFVWTMCCGVCLPITSSRQALFCPRTTSVTAMGGDTVLESVQVFGRKVSSSLQRHGGPL